MERKILEIDNEILFYTLEPDLTDDIEDEEHFLAIKELLDKYRLIDKRITSSDNYDGGASYEAIIKDLTDNKFYKVNYTEWDMDFADSWGPYTKDGVSLPSKLQEVFPQEKIVTVYI